MGRHGSRSVNWSEQIHKKPLITSDEILRFREGKCVITSPAYGNAQEALFPYKLKVPISQQDKQRAKQSEKLWSESIKAQLIARCEKLQHELQQDEGRRRKGDSVRRMQAEGRRNTEDVQSPSKQKQSIENEVSKPKEGKRSETLPTNQTSALCPKTSALPPKADKDWITNELNKRIEAAARLLPLPEELESSAVAAQPETQKLIEELNQAGKAIAISNKRKVKPAQRNYSS